MVAKAKCWSSNWASLEFLIYLFCLSGIFCLSLNPNMFVLTSSSHHHIAILGAGLMGRLLALELAREGHRVEIFEAKGVHADGAAARVAAAMLAPLAESAVTEPGVVRMGQYALSRWPQLLAALDGQHVFFQQNGTLVVWHRQDAADAARLCGLFEKNCHINPNLPHPQALNVQHLAQLEPALGKRFQHGVYLPQEGQLDNRQLLDALAQTLTRQQVIMHWQTPRETTDFSPGMAGEPDLVLDCRGLGARVQWPSLRGVRGEVVRVHAPQVVLQRPTRLVHPRYPLYIAPKEQHLFVIGATEIESDDMGPASVRSTMELLSALYTVHPGFAEARILEIATQCRPTLPDNLPALRWMGDRVLQINGLYRHGYMISPAMLDITLQHLRTGHTELAQQFDVAVHTV